MTIKEAAPIIGVSEQYLRELMRFKLIDIGFAEKLPGKTRMNYVIFPDKLEKFMKGEKNNG